MKTFVIYVTDYRDNSFVVEVEGTSIMLQQMCLSGDASDVYLMVLGEEKRIVFATNHIRFVYEKEAVKKLTITKEEELEGKS